MLDVLLSGRRAIFKSLRIALRLPMIRILSPGLMLGMPLHCFRAAVGCMQLLLRLTGV